ncbi:MAG: hypothetical protein ABI574_06565 [Burkholderiales bacterium]
MTISIADDKKTLDQTIAAIEALDLGPIKLKATRKEDGYGWTPEHADRMALAYKRYLILCAKYPLMTLAPDQDTDRFWHMHILDTRKYAADCDAIFGHFLHHFPYLGLRGADDEKALQSAFDSMRALLAEEFGTTGHPHQAAFCAADAQPAFCAADSKQAQQAAFCAADAKPAFCAADGAVPLQAAFCAAEAKPAFCAADGAAQTKAAFCAAESAPAFCAADMPAAKAAFCAADAKPAFCAAEGLIPQKVQPAFCAATVSAG